jgi:16S rRNA processing protein RimM
MAVPGASCEWITLAVVIKTQGRRGEVALELHSDIPGRFQPGMQLWALLKNNERREVTIADLWPHKNFLVLKFKGVDTISDAEPFVGAELQLPSNERAELEPGWMYLSDLEGCSVFDGEREIGKIEAIQFGAGEAPLLVVRRERSKQSYEIPFAEAFLEKIDLDRKELRMKLPEGLLEVNERVGKSKKDESR